MLSLKHVAKIVHYFGYTIPFDVKNSYITSKCDTFVYFCIVEGKNILHIELKKSGEHIYSNSLNILLEKAGFENAGVAPQTVRNYMSKRRTDVFENDLCIIRKGIYYPIIKPNVSKAQKKSNKFKM